MSTRLSRLCPLTSRDTAQGHLAQPYQMGRNVIYPEDCTPHASGSGEVVSRMSVTGLPGPIDEPVSLLRHRFLFDRLERRVLQYRPPGDLGYEYFVPTPGTPFPSWEDNDRI